MPCYKPLRAWRRDDGEIVFAERGRIHSELTLACGQCIGCRLERSRQWAIRCMHEAKMHRHNCFLTLTYNDENLPPGRSLDHRDVQLFNKRLLKALGSKRNSTIVSDIVATSRTRRHGATPHTPVKTFRFYMAGEYGAQFQRPHYHLCIFGLDFQDKTYLARTPTKSKLYRSPTLEKIWTKGFSSIGEVNFESAAYVARYVMKKITGHQADKHYQRIDTQTGEIHELKPEYNNMSRRPGIGKAWLDRYQADVYPHAKVIVRGRETNPPRYYDKLYKQRDPVAWEAIEYDRYIQGKQQYQEQLPHRLQAREKVAAAKISMLKRKI